MNCVPLGKGNHEKIWGEKLRYTANNTLHVHMVQSLSKPTETDYREKKMMHPTPNPWNGSEGYHVWLYQKSPRDLGEPGQLHHQKSSAIMQ